MITQRHVHVKNAFKIPLLRRTLTAVLEEHATPGEPK